jgi:Ca2+/Na+ antiporter
MTGLVGFAWLIFILSQGSNVTFLNESIQYQMPMLLGVVAIKYISLAINNFRTKKSLFYWNCGGYISFLIIAVLIDYKNEMMGTA